MFFRAGEIDAWGRGVERIIVACKKAGYPEPKFKYDGGSLWTIFTFKYQKNDQMSQQEIMIINLIKTTPYISRKELATQLKIHDSSIKRRLATLQEKSIIRRVGPDKGGYWEIIN